MSALLNDYWSDLEREVSALGYDSPNEIVINEPGRLFIDSQGRWELIECPWMHSMWLDTFCAAVSGHANQPLDPLNPELASDLPTGQRIQIVLPPCVPSGKIAISIRWPSSTVLTLEELSQLGLFDNVENGKERLRQAVNDQKTIVVSGGCSSGKTTLLNALLHELDSNDRIVCIEDSQELRLPCINSVFLKHIKSGANANTIDDLLKTTLRLTPDRIMLGELKGVEAFTWLNAVLSGHPGSMTSLHAETPAHAINRLAMLITSAGIRWDIQHIHDFVTQVVDVVVQIKRLPRSQGSKRVITEIWEPNKESVK